MDFYVSAVHFWNGIDGTTSPVAVKNTHSGTWHVFFNTTVLYFTPTTYPSSSYSLTDLKQFPYALRALPTTLSTKWTSPELATYISAFPSEHRASPATLQAHIEDLTARDVKDPALKSLQGYLWESGYKTGAYSTPLFNDVAGRVR